MSDIDEAIAALFLRGRRVSEVIAAGLAQQPGWKQPAVIDLLTERGWKLDSDGRIPRQYRTTSIVPGDTLPGAPPPALGEPASWPERGTVTTTRGIPVAQLIADGRAHQVARIRRLADKADEALRTLRDALKAEEDRDAIRSRLADLDAERDRLRAQLTAPTRPVTAKATTPPAANDRPITHGTWGGYQAHIKRGSHPCDDCGRAKDEQMQAMRARKTTA